MLNKEKVREVLAKFGADCLGLDQVTKFAVEAALEALESLLADDITEAANAKLALLEGKKSAEPPESRMWQYFVGGKDMVHEFATELIKGVKDAK